MALSKPIDRPHYPDQELREFAVATNVNIHRGAALSFRSSGYVGPLVAGEKNAGFAYESANNTGGANGAVRVRSYVRGSFEVPLSSAAITDLGLALYASADDAFTKTSSSNTFIGKISGFPKADTVIVDIDMAFGQIAAP
jgi:hypothetical protein